MRNAVGATRWRTMEFTPAWVDDRPCQRSMAAPLARGAKPQGPVTISSRKRWGWEVTVVESRTVTEPELSVTVAPGCDQVLEAAGRVAMVVQFTRSVEAATV